MAGPPTRISIFTPVSTPPRRHQLTRSRPSCRCRPRSRRRGARTAPPCSASGFQSVCTIDGLGARARERDVASARPSSPRRRRWWRRRLAVVAAPPPVVADDESLSSPHEARSRKPASGAASQAALVVLRMCPPCWWSACEAIGERIRSDQLCLRPLSCQAPTTRLPMIPKIQNTTTTEQRGEDDRPEELLGLDARSVVVDEHADARLALPEEEVADDRADHGETGRDAEAREDRGHRPPEAAAARGA